MKFEVEELLRLGKFSTASELLKSRGKNLSGKDIVSLLSRALGKPLTEEEERFYFLLLKELLSRPNWKKLLSEIAGIGDREFKNWYLFRFPVVNDRGEGRIVEGILIKHTGKGGRVLFGKKVDLSRVESAAGEGFFVVFESGEFKGNSFEAPLLYTVLYGPVPEPFLLSGVLKGNGFEADEEEAKRRLALSEGKVLISRSRDISRLRELLETDEVQLPLLTVRKSGQQLKLFSKEVFKGCNYGLEELKSLGLTDRDLTFQLPSNIPPGNWMEYVVGFSKKLRRLSDFASNLGKRFRFHLGFDGPASLFLGFGVATGMVPFTVYHYRKETSDYVRVTDCTRDYKERTEEFRELRFSLLEGKMEEACIEVKLASHEPFFPNCSSVLEVEIKTKRGNIELEKFVDVVRELYSFFNLLYDRGVRKFKVILSVPVVVGFLLGTAIGNYWDIEVYQYFKPEEKVLPVLNLREIETFDRISM